VQFELSEDQQAIAEAIQALLAQHAGPARAIELGAKDGYDRELEQALAAAGFLELARGPETGLLEAVLLTEAAARAGAVAAIGARVIVAPYVLAAELPGPIALCEAGRSGAVRFAAHARSLLRLEGDRAVVVSLAPGDVEPVRSSLGYPFGRVRAEGTGESLPAGAGERLADGWRLALSAEAVGTMAACLQVTVSYLKERRQFGRAIGSFQAVQHRLADCAVQVEGARWLTYEAAWRLSFTDGGAEAVAGAAAYALDVARDVFDETHQLSGAIGFTREHDLHVWSMRLQALRLELGGVAAHRRALARSRWS
jgi:alkylation response protein AidB-like acyl-CoA dehydrogenase